MDYADNIFFVLVINRQPGKTVAGKSTENGSIAVINVAEDHVHPGGENFLDPDIVKFDSGFNQSAFVPVDGTLTLDFVYDDFEFVFSDAVPAGFLGI